MKHDRILTLMMASVLSFTSIITSGGLHASAEEGTQNVQTSTAPEAQATGTTQVGSMLSERLNKEASKMQDTEGCNIFSIESDGSAATVHFAASQDCRLVVGLYSDIYADGYEKMLGSVIRDVKAGEETAVVSFGTEMPQYYVLRAYLIGDNDVPLCEVYAEENYTKDIMDLKASDIHSYAGYEVLNLDEQENTNFLVYKKDVKVLKSSEAENILTVQDAEQGIYTIRNLSSDIAAGDTVSVEGDDAVIFRVSSLETADGVTIVQADPAMQTADAFSFIKIEMDPEDFAPDPEEDAASAPSGQRPAQSKPMTNSENDAAPSLSDGTGWSGSHYTRMDVTGDTIDIPGIDGEVTVAKLKYTISMNYAASFDLYCTEGRIKTALYLEVDATTELMIEGNISAYFPLWAITCNSGLGVSLDLGIFLKVELDGYLASSNEYSCVFDTTGFHVHVDTDNLRLEAYAFVGIVARARLAIIGVKAKAELGAGLHLDCKTAEPHSGCTSCWEFQLSVQFYCDFELGYGFFHLGYFADKRYVFANAYYSDALGGFHFGLCPNRQLHGTSGTSSPGTDPDNPGTNPGTNPDNPGTVPPEEEDDGLTDEQREYLDFSSRIKGGWAVSVKPSHVDDIESIEIPASYRGRPVIMVGTGYYTSKAYQSDYEVHFLTESVNYQVSWSKDGTRSDDAGFEGCKNLKSVRLPDTIQAIGAFAFAGCTALEDINLPDSVTSIESYAFVCCSNLKLDKLPDQIHEIGTGAFADCEKVFETLTFPTSLTRMGKSVFANCDGIQSVSVALPAIPESTFSNCKGLKKATVQEPTLSIKRSAFYNCSSLEEVELPESLLFIGDYAFSNVSNTLKLKKFRLPQNLCTLGCEALFASSIPELEIPPTLKKINRDILKGNNTIKKIVLPQTVQYIDFSAFNYTSNLNAITILNPNAEFAALAEDGAANTNQYYKTRKMIYGYSGSTTETFCAENGFRFTALDRAPVTTSFGGFPDHPEDPVKTVTIKDLKPNTLYNFYDLLGTVFTSDNLLYLSQGTTDQNGTLTIWYRPVKDDTDANKYVRCYEPAETETTASTGTTAVSVTPPSVCGDLNEDGTLDVSDAVLLARFIAEDSEVNVSEHGRLNADCNHNGKLDSDDVILMLKAIAMLITL